MKNSHKFNRLLALIMLLISLHSTSLLALTLEEAKQDGLVGEQADGYLGLITSTPTDELHSLLRSINDKRKTKYREIATRNGTSLNSVESLAGSKAIEKTENGLYIQSPNGDWQKK